MRALAAGLIALTVAGCTATDPTMMAANRTLARRVVDEAVARRLPGIDVTPYSDCVIDNAGAGELARLAGFAITGVGPEAAEIVAGIIQRRETLTCLGLAGLGV